METLESVSTRVALAIGLAAMTFAAEARAAEYTDVLDAADDKDDYAEETFDPFDFNLEPGFSFETTRATINREAPCITDSNDDSDASPRADDGCRETGVVTDREALYRHQRATFDVTMRIGMFKDLELRIRTPFVLTDRYAMKYPGARSPKDSSIDPNDSRIKENAKNVFDESGGSEDGKLKKLNRFRQHRFFDLSRSFAENEYTRAGVGDPSIGLRWAPYNDQRDDTKATLMFGFDYVAPIAEVRKPDNDGVGEGLHKLEWQIRSSKKFAWLDPYFGLDYQLSLAARNSPIKNLEEIDATNDGQTITFPPHEADFTVGTEFIPYENESEGEKYVIDTRFTFGYTSEGRAYSPLYEHLVNSNCNGMKKNDILPTFDGGELENPGGVGCSWIAQRPANLRPPPPKYNLGNLKDGDRFETNGIMTVESHATFTGRLGFIAQPSEYFQIGARVELEHQQSHRLTNARTGRDVADDRETQGDDQVDLTGKDAALERNPAYNPVYDSSGGGFTVSGYNTWRFVLNTAVQF